MCVLRLFPGVAIVGQQVPLCQIGNCLTSVKKWRAVGRDYSIGYSCACLVRVGLSSPCKRLDRLHT